MVLQLKGKNKIIFAFYRKEAIAVGGCQILHLEVNSGSW